MYILIYEIFKNRYRKKADISKKFRHGYNVTMLYCHEVLAHSVDTITDR